jgi:hypothetical protein
MKNNYIRSKHIKSNPTDAKTQSNKGWARRLLVEAAIITALAAGIIYIKSCPSQRAIQTVQATAYSEARSNPGKRQQYLEILAAKGGMPANLRIEYMEDYSERLKVDPDELMSTMANFPGGFEGTPEEVKKLTLHTKVSPGAFEFARTEDEFMSMLEHELIHAELWSGTHQIDIDKSALSETDRIFSLDGDLFRTFNELEAYKMQIGLFPSRKLSKGFTEGIIAYYNKHRRNLEKKEPTPLVRWMLNKYPEIKE